MSAKSGSKHVSQKSSANSKAAKSSGPKAGGIQVGKKSAKKIAIFDHSDGSYTVNLKLAKPGKMRFDKFLHKKRLGLNQEDLLEYLVAALQEHVGTLAKSRVSITNPDTEGSNTLAPQKPDLFYAFISSYDPVEETQEDEAHVIVHLQAIEANMFHEIWDNMYAETDEAKQFTEFVTSNDWTASYSKLDADTRLLLMRVHLHFQMWTMNQEVPPRQANITIRINGNNSDLDALLEYFWVALEFGQERELQDLGGLYDENWCVYQNKAINVEDDGEEVERQYKLHIIPKDLAEVLKGLYFTHYYFEVDPDSEDRTGIIPNPYDIDPKIFQERRPPEFYFPKPNGGYVPDDDRIVEEDPWYDQNQDDGYYNGAQNGDGGWDNGGGWGGGWNGGDDDGSDGDDDGGGDDENSDDDDDDAPPPAPPANEMLYHPGGHQPFVGVHNIGSGNCVSIYGRGGQPIAYTDFGYPFTANVHTYPGHTAGAPIAFPCVCNDPVMILSHWDFDHYAMSQRVPECYHLRWMAPQQFMGPNDARTLYMRILLNVGGAGSAALYIWPAGAAGHLVAPFGTIERGNGPGPLTAAGRNDSCLITHVRVEDDLAGPPAVTWPAAFGNAPAPVPAGAAPPLPFPLPAAGALPGIGAAIAGGLPAGPIGLGNPVNGGALPAFQNGERYILLPGDNGFNHIASLAAGVADAALPRVVGTMAPHHGADSWLPGGVGGTLNGLVAAMPAHGVMGAAPVLAMGSAMPAAAAMLTTAIPPSIGTIRPTGGFIGAAPGVDPLTGIAAIPAGCILGGGRIAYSYGIRANTGVHPYGHPRNSAVLAHLGHGWSSRMNTTLHDWDTLTAALRYFPGFAGVGGYPIAAPNPHRANHVALGWQDDGTGAGTQTYLWRDVVPGGPGGAGNAINRTCPTCARNLQFSY